MIRLILLAAGFLSLGLAGKAPLAKLMLVLNLPSLAAPLLDDPAIKGVALYKAGQYQAADDAFRLAGRGSTYNRGLSLAATGNYPLSLAYFDAVLFTNPADSFARENRNAVNALVPPHLGESNAAGRIAADGGPSAPVNEANPLLKPLDAGGRVADEDWLSSLPDEPGEFLRLRLAEEYQRRLAMGLTPPEEGDPW